MRKPILCLDFDGVIHSYTSGWQGANVVSDPPVPGAIAFLREAVKHFQVHIFSSRSNQEGGRTAMVEWLGYWSVKERASDDEVLSWLSDIVWPTEKPPALVTIDDRALLFTGSWPAMETLLKFQPWNKAGFKFVPASQQLIFSEIAGERAYQDKRWGGAAHDDTHTSHDWIAYLTHYAGEAVSWPFSASKFRRSMVIVASLAVAAIEWVDRGTQSKGLDHGGERRAS